MYWTVGGNWERMNNQWHAEETVVQLVCVVNICSESSITGVKQCFLHPGRFPASHADPGDFPHSEESWIHGAVTSWRHLGRPSVLSRWDSQQRTVWICLLSGFQLRTNSVFRPGGRVFLSNSVNFLCTTGLLDQDSLKFSQTTTRCISGEQGATCCSSTLLLCDNTSVLNLKSLNSA